MTNSERRAFTLVELLISVVLIVTVMTIATSTCMQFLAIARRMQAIQTMNASAKTVFEVFSRDVSAMHPCTAAWLTSNAADKSVEMVFMSSKFDTYDYRDNIFFPGIKSKKSFSDLLWRSWYWDYATNTLHVSQSSSVRRFRIFADQSRDYWKINGGSRMGTVLMSESGFDNGLPYFSTFLSIPRPQRGKGTATMPNRPVDLLNANRWDSNDAMDIGDYDDLIRNRQALLINCSELTLEFLGVDGVPRTATGASGLTWAASGSHVDGRNQADLRDRPCLVRLRFTLTDPKTHATCTYSFSCSTPSFTHY